MKRKETIVNDTFNKFIEEKKKFDLSVGKPPVAFEIDLVSFITLLEHDNFKSYIDSSQTSGNIPTLLGIKIFIANHKKELPEFFHKIPDRLRNSQCGMRD